MKAGIFLNLIKIEDMGSYCASRDGKEIVETMSPFQEAEKIMLLETIPIGEFHRTIKSAAKD